MEFLEKADQEWVSSSRMIHACVFSLDLFEFKFKLSLLNELERLYRPHRTCCCVRQLIHFSNTRELNCRAFILNSSQAFYSNFMGCVPRLIESSPRGRNTNSRSTLEDIDAIKVRLCGNLKFHQHTFLIHQTRGQDNYMTRAVRELRTMGRTEYRVGHTPASDKDRNRIARKT